MAELPRVIKRRDLIDRFKELGWDGPMTGTGKHPQFMAKGTAVVKIPNRHNPDEISVKLLGLILKEAGISRNEWIG